MDIVTDKLHLEEEDVMEIINKLEIDRNDWDKRLLYEVTGLKADGIDFDSGSDSDEDEEGVTRFSGNDKAF